MSHSTPASYPALAEFSVHVNKYTALSRARVSCSMYTSLVCFACCRISIDLPPMRKHMREQYAHQRYRNARQQRKHLLPKSVCVCARIRMQNAQISAPECRNMRICIHAWCMCVFCVCICVVCMLLTQPQRKSPLPSPSIIPYSTQQHRHDKKPSSFHRLCDKRASQDVSMNVKKKNQRRRRRR